MTMLHTADADGKNQTPVGASNPLPVAMSPVAGGIPVGMTQVIGTANVAHAAATATLAAAASLTNYLTGFEVTFGGATGASLVTVTVAGTKGGSPQYTIAVPAGVTLAGTPLIVEFNPPLQASAANTAITVSVPDLGVGNTACTVVSHGYQG